jgi:hypothetical protein
MRECQLRSDLNWQGPLNQKSVILGLGVYVIAAAGVSDWCDILFEISVASSGVGTQWSHDALNWRVKTFFYSIQINHQLDATISPVYYLDVYLQLNMFQASSRPMSGAQQLQ